MCHRFHFLPGKPNKLRAFTLMELLVAIAVIGILISLLLPAVQSARDAARRVGCSSNMRQLAMAATQYESIHRRMPPSVIDLHTPGLPKHNVLALLLPYIEQVPLAERYQLDCEWFRVGEYTSPSGRECQVENGNVAAASIPIFRCPASPLQGKTEMHTDDFNGIYGTADYFVCGKVLKDTQAYDYLIDTHKMTEESLEHRSICRPILYNKATKEVDDETISTAGVTDGLSNSIMFTESGGRPDYYSRDRRTHSKYDIVSGSAWADHEAVFGIHHECSGRLMNCNNDNEIYSFHCNGVMFAFGDSSVKFLDENTDPVVLVALLSADGGEAVEMP